MQLDNYWKISESIKNVSRKNILKEKNMFIELDEYIILFYWTIFIIFIMYSMNIIKHILNVFFSLKIILSNRNMKNISKYK